MSVKLRGCFRICKTREKSQKLRKTSFRFIKDATASLQPAQRRNVSGSSGATQPRSREDDAFVQPDDPCFLFLFAPHLPTPAKQPMATDFRGQQSSVNAPRDNVTLHQQDFASLSVTFAPGQLKPRTCMPQEWLMTGGATIEDPQHANPRTPYILQL